ncbi:uncharacterized protein Z518_10321 [Rhinocladiella mackenziei CBS 650.93]|uniref:Rhinocladiella mackenziei CBS 650.93 unplaced genomic scaffold supercont1.9, whole genome shotgun sequence n=1 Tax=Rhinocladiella mackenziei CBS 650.93 TaxID=1442369 RepID=A0A0D2GPA3_9EURO|nr:uncharacterized protein Z518_10321 [Rhinocladiella mackenziei CBS 650.93]KIX00183.1 hypothetical protein Z518_10321 [Rhinocladiella mackenziei CBS 650.93]
MLLLPLPLPIFFSSLALYALPILSQETQTIEVVATTITHYYTIAASTVPLSPQYTSSLDFRTSVLNSTNFYRYEHSASYIYWNESLAEYAQSYSEQCIWEHSHGVYGENLARGYTNVTAAVEAWGNEREDYDFDENDPTGFTEATGHFTQLVWKSTQSTGCGWTDCDGKNGLDGVFLVCEYWPPGNIMGDDNRWFIDNVEPERSGGDNGFDELEATQGATGDVPSSTGSSNSPPASATSPGGESLGSPSIEVDRSRLLTAVCVTVAAVLFGLGMS